MDLPLALSVVVPCYNEDFRKRRGSSKSPRTPDQLDKLIGPRRGDVAGVALVNRDAWIGRPGPCRGTICDIAPITWRPHDRIDRVKTGKAATQIAQTITQ